MVINTNFAAISNKQKKVNTCLINYGVDHNSNTEEYKIKCKET